MNLILTAKFGDGCLHKNKTCKEYKAYFSGTDLSWQEFKARSLQATGRISETPNLGWGSKPIYSFSTPPSEEATRVFNLSVEEAILELSVEDLVVWYLDDGSWHKKKHFMHLYSNKLTKDQTKLLADRIESLLGLRPAMREDRKKDGRVYNYLYFGVNLAKAFLPYVQSLLVNNKLCSLYYKVGMV